MRDEQERGGRHLEPRGSDEPGDQILDHPADGGAGDASSGGRGRSLDRQAQVAGGRWAEPAADRGEADEDAPDA